MLLILDTGIRLTEVASVTKDNLGVDTLRVTGKRRQREVPISQELRILLNELGDDAHPWTSARSNRPLTRAGVQWAYRRIFGRVGIPGGAHRLRHTFATQYLRNNGSIVHLQRTSGTPTSRPPRYTCTWSPMTWSKNTTEFRLPSPGLQQHLACRKSYSLHGSLI